MRPINLAALVDDDEICTYIEKTIIEGTSLVNKIKAFSNGKEALDFITAHAQQPDQLPEIILLDLNMPVMDGWEFLQAIVKIKPCLDKKITIYIVSSSVSHEDLMKIKSLGGVSDYIIKPLTKDKFEK